LIRHCVFCTFKSEVSAQERLNAVKAFEALVGQVDGLVSVDAGPNKDFEEKSAAFSHGFIVTFRDRVALGEYAEHPTHKALGAELVAKCTGGADGVMVFDLEVE